LECNATLERLVGRSKAEFQDATRWTQDGFLPWGADAYALISELDEDVLHYVCLCSASFSRLPWPSSFPAVRKVVLTVDVAVTCRGGSATPVTMTVTVIESLAMERTSVDASFVFEERESLPSSSESLKWKDSLAKLDFDELGIPPSQSRSVDDMILEYLELL
jgi:hypothetical protein